MYWPTLTLQVILTVLLPAGPHGTHVSAEHFQRMDVFELEFAEDPQVSPNGEWVAYVRQSMDIMTDRPRKNIWVVSADGRHHRPLLSGTADYSSPRWSPSGDRIAYVSSIDDRGPELHLRWMDTGQTAMLTNLSYPPSDITWSPDGHSIAFNMFVKSDGLTLASPPDKPKGAVWAAPAKIIDSLRYRADGKGYLEPGYTHIFLVPSVGGTPRQLTSGDFDHKGVMSFARDGKRLFFSANRNEDWEYDPVESDIWSVDIDAGTLKQLTTRKGPDSAPAVSPDGKRVAYLGFDDKMMGYHNVEAYVMDVNGENSKAVASSLDRSIRAVKWDGSSKGLYIQFDDRGVTNIAHVVSDKIDRLARDIGGASLGRPYAGGSFSVSDNGLIAYTKSRADRPAEICVGRPSGSMAQVTQLNDDLLAHKALGAVTELTWSSSADSLEIQGWLVTPPDFDPKKKYPLILEIHGGPFAAYGPHFSAEMQLYAAAGYVVLYANPRGSTSYGYEFANHIHHRYPGQDYDDLMSGVDTVIARGIVKEDELFVTGGSGGGVLTAWIVGKTDRFKAAVVAKPVINWISTVLTTDIATFMPKYWFAEPPWKDPTPYWERSPLSLVGNVTTPTMLMTGELDFRTPIAESEQYYQALKLRKVDTALVRIPDSPHGIAGRPSRLIGKVDNILAWFERYGNKKGH